MSISLGTYHKKWHHTKPKQKPQKCISPETFLKKRKTAKGIAQLFLPFRIGHSTKKLNRTPPPHPSAGRVPIFFPGGEGKGRGERR